MHKQFKYHLILILKILQYRLSIWISTTMSFKFTLITNLSVSVSKVQWPELSQLSLCSVFDKENSMEFSLIPLSTYTLYYCGYALTLPWSSCYSSHVTSCDCDIVTWPSVTIRHTIVTLWQSHVILSHALPCSCKSKEKEKEKKYK